MADTEKPIDLTVLLPAYNEEDAIGPTLEELVKVLEGLDVTWELLVVNDCSTDKTAEIAKSYGARVVNRVQQAGSGASRRTGILASRGKIVCMMDADGSYDPSTIPEMLSYFPDYDQVNGARHKEMGTMPLIRAPVKWMLRMIASYLTKFRIPDLNTGLKAFKREEMVRFLWVMPDGFSCVTTMTLAFLCNDMPVKYVPTTYRKRLGKSKFHPIDDTMRYFLTIIRMVMYFRPLSIFVPTAFVFFLMAVTKSYYDFFILEIDGERFGRLQLSDVILFLASGFTLIGGLLADLMVSTSKQRLYDLKSKQNQ